MMAVEEEEVSFSSMEDLAAEAEELSADAQKIINNMKSSSGVEFAPWMKVDAEAIAKAKKEREERKKRSAAAAVGAGGGLKSKVLSEEEIELRWSTQDERDNAGIIVQRRMGGQPDFQDIATYERFAPLRTKGVDGGDYVYLDDTAEPGTWVYRILDCDTRGTRSAVCQKLV